MRSCARAFRSDASACAIEARLCLSEIASALRCCAVSPVCAKRRFAFALARLASAWRTEFVASVESSRPRICPCWTSWPGFTSTLTTVPEVSKFTFRSLAACTVPDADTEDRTTPRETVAVRGVAFAVVLLLPTAK